MRIALVTSAGDQRTRGNHTTLRRWLAHDLPVEVVAVDADPNQDFEEPFDLFHGYHALHGGVAAKALAERHGRPLVISLGGTDLFALLAGDQVSEVVGEVLRAARVITGAFPLFGALVGHGLPYETVPRAFDPKIPLQPRENDGRLRVLLPAGLRPVKDIRLALRLHRELRLRGLPIDLRIVGPVLDEEYAVQVLKLARELEGVSVGELPPEAMGVAYSEADLVWNCSRQEGGANSLVEALAHGCAVFARDVIGNRDFLGQEGAPGQLFFPTELDLAEEFHRGVLEESEQDRWERARSARRWLEKVASPELEREALMRSWQRALA